MAEETWRTEVERVRDGRVEEGKGRTNVFSGLDESEKGDSWEVADRKEGHMGRGPRNVGSGQGTGKCHSGRGGMGEGRWL